MRPQGQRAFLLFVIVGLLGSLACIRLARRIGLLPGDGSQGETSSPSLTSTATAGGFLLPPDATERPQAASPKPGANPTATTRPQAPSGPMRMYTVQNANGRNAICNDGSPATYYFRAGSTETSRVWVIHLQGGGYCYDQGTCANRARSLPNFMTTDGNPNTRPGDGIHSTSASRNPDFYAANHVYLSYCSSDMWSGDRAASSQTFQLHFRGLAIFRAVVQDLMNSALTQSPNLGQAEVVLLSGSSAGGGGVMVHLDWLAQQLSGAVVKGINDAGWFIQSEPYQSSIPSPVEAAQLGYRLWNGTVDASCAAAYRGREGNCYIGPLAYPYIETPMFVQIAQFDGPQLVGLGITLPINSDEETFALDFAARVRSSLTPVEAAFSPATRTHGLLAESRFWSLRINGVSLQAAVSSWFFGQSGPTKLIEN